MTQVFDKNFIQELTEKARIKRAEVKKTRRLEMNRAIENTGKEKATVLLELLPGKIKEIAQKEYSSCGIEIPRTDYTGSMGNDKFEVSKLSGAGKIIFEWFSDKNFDVYLDSQLYDSPDGVYTKIFLVILWKLKGEKEKDTSPFIPTLERTMPLIFWVDYWENKPGKMCVDYPDD